MTTLTITYQNGHVRTVTAVSATPSDAAGAVIVSTAEDGDIIVTQEDMPDVYAQVLLLGLL